MSDFSSIIGWDETLTGITERHDLYPTIDPEPLYTAQTFRGKVVLITGASRGIGQHAAAMFARAGAALSITARSQEGLDATKALILEAVPDARILVHVVDVKDTAKAEAVVADTIKEFGRLDVLVANSGALTPFSGRAGDKDPAAWWNTFEVNIKGTFNYVRAAIPHIEKAKGRIFVIGSSAAQVRAPFTSDYGTSKHALVRFVEYIAMEYPEVKTFYIHPGFIITAMGHEAWEERFKDVNNVLPQDTLSLPGGTLLYLATGKADWLSGRYLASNWDLAELERDWKDKIVGTNALVSKLAIP